MQKRSRQWALASIVAVMLMSLAGVAAAINEDTALTGTVVSVNHDLNYVTVRDDVTGRNFKIDTRAMNTRRSIDVWNLRTGDRISSTGAWEDNDTYRADRVMNASPRVLNRLASGITGTVQDVNRGLNYITIRDQSTGQIVKVDVRKIDTRRSANVWQLRNGDVVTTQGSWTKRGQTFRADYVNFGSGLPMASGYQSPNLVSGVVESINRDLNYFTVRDDATGRSVKIDVRDMDTRRSVNVWNLRAGDRITVDGSWTGDNDRFKAGVVRF